MLFILIIFMLLLLCATRCTGVVFPGTADVESVQTLMQELVSRCPDVARALGRVRNVHVCGNTCNTCVVNKEHVYMQTRDACGKMHPREMLVEMLTHELAHVVTPEIGHTDGFMDTFRDMHICARD